MRTSTVSPLHVQRCLLRNYAIGFALCVALIYGALATARAEVLYDNVTATTTGRESIGSPDGPLYDSFSTGASAVTFTNLQLKLFMDAFDFNASLTVKLFSDNSGAPGSALDTLAVIPDNNFAAGENGTYSVAVSSISLAADTRYWIGLSTGDLNLSWDSSTHTSGFGVSSEYFDDASGVSSNTSGSGPYQMEVTAAPVAAPELDPAQAAVALTLFLGALAILCDRRRKPKALSA